MTNLHNFFPEKHFVGCKTELQMMYAGSKLGLVGEGGFTKVHNLSSTTVIIIMTFMIVVLRLRICEHCTASTSSQKTVGMKVRKVTNACAFYLNGTL